jgi:endonuclease/exonuclease/phosphatase family metal-dependent hydrolase
MFRARQAASSRTALLLLLIGAITFAACDDATDITRDTADVTVMTRNLYLGADIFLITQASSPQEIPVIVAQIFGTMQFNDFYARAGALAAEIQATDPDLIGLQEVSLYRIQDPSDYVTGQTEPNATEVFIDFLDVLMDSISARGMDYRVASQVVNADVEMPAARNATEFFDVRLTDRDVILARADVQTRNPGAESFEIIVPFELASGDTIWFDRGYTWVDATVDGVDFVFANTHLEVSAGGQLAVVQAAQATQMMQRFAAAPRVIAVGDFNTGPGDQPYSLLTGTFTDAWSALGTGGPGLTCCFPELLNQTGDLYSRIDLILYRGDIDVLSASVVGDRPADRTPGGLWPSDHAGVVATLRVRN